MKNLRSLRRSQQGQVLPLAAVALLATAAMVFISLNISWNVHNRIRLQNAADAKAYSTAVQVARTFNWYAYTNRAIANAYVDMATAHAYMSQVSAMASIEFGMMEGFGEIAAEEEALSDACFAEWDIGGGIEHLIHSIFAGIDSLGYLVSWVEGTEGSRIQELDSSFTGLINALDLHVKALWGAQELFNILILAKLGLNSDVGDNFRKNNSLAPSSSAADYMKTEFPLLGIQNALKYNSAIDQGSSDDKKIQMTNVVNATRPPYTWDRNGFGAAETVDEVIMPMFQPIKDDCWIDSDEFVFFVVEEMPNLGFMTGGRSYAGDTATSAHTIGGIFSTDIENTSAGDRISSMDWYNVNFMWHDGVADTTAPSLIPAPIAVGEVETGQTNEHSGSALMGSAIDILNNPCDGSDHSTAMNFDHFTNFKISNSAPFNQPVVYGGASADLKLADNGVPRPWEINGNPLKLNIGGAAPASQLTLSNTGGAAGVRGNGNGVAVSKAMAYYHRFGDWKEEPNFFNPYWRAKMEPWNNVFELDLAAGAVAEGAGASITDSVGGMDAMIVLGNGALNIRK